jgi:Tol biopolymer transport system component
MNPIRHWIPFAAALVAVAAAFSGAAAHATVHGSNGLIVYQATVGKHIQLFTVERDGTGAHQLTRFTDSDTVHASWSPDGSSIAFERDFSNSAGIYTMNLDGSNLVALTPHGLQGLPA